ncbi:MAG TPA: lipopolysaccharide biosynthesis protein [Gemmataceae bacterium]|jgi:O-antigen/teichoic acid export membrane protein
MNDRSFIKHAAVYGLASLLVQAGGFVLLPLYTHYLTPADYGVLEVLGRLAETAGTVLMFGGFRQALLTFYQQSHNETERRRVVMTTLSLFGLTGLVGGGVMLALAGPFSRQLGAFMHGDTSGISAGLLRLAILAILLEPLSQIPMTLLQARVESVRFVSIALAQFLVRVSLCVLFVKYLDGGVAGALGATVLMGTMFGFGLCTRELLRRPARPDLGQFRGLLRFSLPLMPGGLCFLLMHHGDRFFLLRYCDMDDVGTYALGYKLAQAAGMFSLAPLYMVWSAHMYKVARDLDAPRMFGTVFTRILAGYLLAALGLALFQEEVVALLGGAPYASASAVVAPVLLAYFCQSAASLMDAGLYVRRRTGLKLGVTLVTTAVMFVLYAVLIPRYGSRGAAFATLIGFVFLAVCTWAVTQRVFPVRYEWSRLSALLSLAVGLWLVSRLLPAEPWSWPVKVALWLLGPIVVWCMGLMSHREKEHVRALSSEVRLRLLNGLMWSRKYQPGAPATGEESPSLALRAGKEATRMR